METNKDLAGLRSPDVVRRMVEADIRAELQAHLDLATEAELGAGLGQQEARARALDRFGDLELTVRDCTRQKLGEWMMWKRIALVGAVVFVGLGGLLATAAYRARLAQQESEWALASMQLTSAEPHEIIVHVGDRIELHDMYEQLDSTKTYGVDRDGTALLPVLGHVPVAGLTREQLEVRLRERYAPYYELLDLYVRVLEPDAGGGMESK